MKRIIVKAQFVIYNMHKVLTLLPIIDKQCDWF